MQRMPCLFDLRCRTLLELLLCFNGDVSMEVLISWSASGPITTYKLCSQENIWEAEGGSQLEELMGPLDASCTEAAVQGGTASGQESSHVAEHTGPGNEEKSIMPVSASHPTPFQEHQHVVSSAMMLGVPRGAKNVWTALAGILLSGLKLFQGSCQPTACPFAASGHFWVESQQLDLCWR